MISESCPKLRYFEKSNTGRRLRLRRLNISVGILACHRGYLSVVKVTVNMKKKLSINASIKVGLHNYSLLLKSRIIWNFLHISPSKKNSCHDNYSRKYGK